MSEMNEDQESADFIAGYADGLQDGIKGARKNMEEESKELKELLWELQRMLADNPRLLRIKAACFEDAEREVDSLRRLLKESLSVIGPYYCEQEANRIRNGIKEVLGEM